MSNEELCIAIQTEDERFVNDSLLQLMQQNKGFIYKQAMKWAAAFSSRPDIDIDDLTQAAFFAVLEAVERFEPGKKGTFINLLSLTLKTAFSDACGVRTAKKEPLYTNCSRFESPVAGDPDSDLCVGDLIPDASSAEAIEAVEESVFIQQLHDLLEKALATIPGKEARAVEQYYFQGMKQADIAAEMKVNPAYAQQVIMNGVKRLRKCSMIDKLSEALYGEMNLYKHTGFQSWKDTGCSQPEFMLEKKDKRMYKVMMLVNDHGLSFEEASRIIRC